MFSYPNSLKQLKETAKKMSERKQSKLAISSDDGLDAKDSHDGPRPFDVNHERFLMLSLPDIDPDAAMKNRLDVMEETSFVQSRYNTLTGELCSNLDVDIRTSENNLQRVILQVQEKLSEEIFILKREYDHR